MFVSGLLSFTSQHGVSHRLQFVLHAEVQLDKWTIKRILAAHCVVLRKNLLAKTFKLVVQTVTKRCLRKVKMFSNLTASRAA
jgi:hypothetical protein